MTGPKFCRLSSRSGDGPGKGCAHLDVSFDRVRLVGATILEVDGQPNSGIYLVGRSRVTGAYSCRLLPGDRESTSVLFPKT